MHNLWNEVGWLLYKILKTHPPPTSIGQHLQPCFFHLVDMWGQICVLRASIFFFFPRSFFLQSLVCFTCALHGRLQAYRFHSLTHSSISDQLQLGRSFFDVGRTPCRSRKRKFLHWTPGNSFQFPTRRSEETKDQGAWTFWNIQRARDNRRCHAERSKLAGFVRWFISENASLLVTTIEGIPMHEKGSFGRHTWQGNAKPKQKAKYRYGSKNFCPRENRSSDKSRNECSHHFRLTSHDA